MAMTNRNNAKLDCMIYYTLDELVPQDHLVRKMEEALDFRFIYPKVQRLYSRHGRPSIDPVVLFKMLIINIVFGINSIRKTCQEIEVNLADISKLENGTRNPSINLLKRLAEGMGMTLKIEFVPKH